MDCRLGRCFLLSPPSTWCFLFKCITQTYTNIFKISCLLCKEVHIVSMSQIFKLERAALASGYVDRPAKRQNTWGISKAAEHKRKILVLSNPDLVLIGYKKVLLDLSSFWKLPASFWKHYVKDPTAFSPHLTFIVVVAPKDYMQPCSWLLTELIVKIFGEAI